MNRKVPFFPVSAKVNITLVLAIISAYKTFWELPKVEMPQKASPYLPYPFNICANSTAISTSLEKAEGSAQVPIHSK